ncbi:hypothetical protein PMAYCL1PPCAC_14500, partial [Pristionchus mayeri]
MDRLVPFERLQDDYYVGDTIRDGGGHADSDDGSSSDDEVQTALKEIAGYGPDHNCMGEKIGGKTEFEQEMDDELDDRMSDYVRSTMRSEAAKGGEGEQKKEDGSMEEDVDMPPLEEQSEGEEGKPMATSPVKSALRTQKRRSEQAGKEKEKEDVEMAEEGEEKKKVKFADPEGVNESKENEKDKKDKEMEEEEYSSSSEESDDGEEQDNPIKVAARAARKASKEARKKEKSSKTLPDFYNPSEDDDNEEWVQKRRRSNQGKKDDGRKVNPKQIRLEDGSDAVLSCPGCMVLLTRDCQRHEVYKDQYRAMFVENCRVDDEEQLTIEKTGKEKRRERQRRRKDGQSDPVPGEGDMFKAVRCAVCTTKVAVIDHDEVYHFFNMSGAYPVLPSAPVDEPPPPSYDNAMDSDGLPPSYDELYGQFQQVDSPSAFAKFINGAFEALSRTVTATVIFALLNIVPIGMIVIGSVNEENCAAQPKIPTWLIVLGSLYLVKAAVSAYAKWKQSKIPTLYRPHICIRLFNLLLSVGLLVWFIMGSVWVFGVSPQGSKGDPKYCDHFMYTFAFIFIILSYVILALSCFACCCCCCFICCREPREQRERSAEYSGF